MKKLLFSALIVVMLFASLTLVSTTPISVAKATTQTSGIITLDTTWTKANSPYHLTGPVAVNSNATLTIEAGVQVYFSAHYLQVNGSLVAKGTDSDPVSFIAGLISTEGYVDKIIFMPSSKSWDEKTGIGSIIENANIPSESFRITINNASPKINSSYIRAEITINGGTPMFSGNQLDAFGYGLTINNGSPTIIDNTIYSQIVVKDGSPIIFNNCIQNSQSRRARIEVTGGIPYISNNNIPARDTGIIATCGVIERNFISASHVGIEIGNCIVKNNTIESGKLIVVQASSKPTIIYNNFPYAYVAGVDGITLAQGASQDVDASYNWWGTTDIETINQSMFDVKNDFNLGTVNFTPFLTEPNPQAMPSFNAPIPTPIASQTPTITPDYPLIASTPIPSSSTFLEAKTMLLTPIELTIALVIVVAVVATIVGFLLGKKVKHNAT